MSNTKNIFYPKVQYAWGTVATATCYTLIRFWSGYRNWVLVSNNGETQEIQMDYDTNFAFGTILLVCIILELITAWFLLSKQESEKIDEESKAKMNYFFLVLAITGAVVGFFLIRYDLDIEYLAYGDFGEAKLEFIDLLIGASIGFAVIGFVGIIVYQSLRNHKIL